MLAIDDQMRELLRVPGVRSVCLVDWRSSRALSVVGVPAERVEDTAAMVRALRSQQPYTRQDLEDVVVTGADHHLVFALLRDCDLGVQVRMDRDGDNLAFVLYRLRGLVRDTGSPPPSARCGRPSRTRTRTPGPRPAAPAVDRELLERVLGALRSLCGTDPASATGAVMT